MLDVLGLSAMVLVGFLWGATNPLIKRGSKGISDKESRNTVVQFISDVKFLICNWKYMLPFVVNQCGSVLYFFTLQKADLSLAVPVVNSLTFIFTALSGWFLGEEIPSRGTFFGMILVVVGITMCVLDKVVPVTF